MATPCPDVSDSNEINRTCSCSIPRKWTRRQLKAEGASEGTLEVVTRAITMLTINNKANQDYIRCCRLSFLVVRAAHIA